MEDKTLTNTDNPCIALQPLVRRGLNNANLEKEDRFYTPNWCAKDMVNFFDPCGLILEPCSGIDSIYQFLPKNSLWCEIDKGRDFFLWSKKVDWIISNPPYSIWREWLRHSFRIADNIVYLIPLRRMFGVWGIWKESYDYGGIVHIRHYGTGTKLKYPTGNAFAAVYWKRNYEGKIEISFYKDENQLSLNV